VEIEFLRVAMIPKDIFNVKVLGVATIPEASSDVEVLGEVVPLEDMWNSCCMIILLCSTQESES